MKPGRWGVPTAERPPQTLSPAETGAQARALDSVLTLLLRGAPVTRSPEAWPRRRAVQGLSKVLGSPSLCSLTQGEAPQEPVYVVPSVTVTTHGVTQGKQV